MDIVNKSGLQGTHADHGKHIINISKVPLVFDLQAQEYQYFQQWSHCWQIFSPFLQLSLFSLSLSSLTNKDKLVKDILEFHDLP